MFTLKMFCDDYEYAHQPSCIQGLSCSGTRGLSRVFDYVYVAERVMVYLVHFCQRRLH